MIWIFGIVLYIAISVWWFLHIMGEKFRKEKWYDWPMLLPALGICYLIGWYLKLQEQRK